MAEAQLSRFPHLSWLGFSTVISPSTGPACFNWHASVHSVDFISRGHGRGRTLCRGRESHRIGTPGMTIFCPADGESYIEHIWAHEEVHLFSLLVPKCHLDSIAAEDHAPAHAECRRLFLAGDTVLQSCMNRLMQSTDLQQGMDVGKDEAARQLVLQLVRLSSGGRPDWHDDLSTFDRRTLVHLVEYIDAHLKVSPSLSDMGARVGLSPSHFAKKFRQSTGLSLQRFTNMRRILASLESLKNQSEPLAHCAIALGFCSQAHFTQIFSQLTGTTPAKYQKRCRPVVG